MKNEVTVTSRLAGARPLEHLVYFRMGDMPYGMQPTAPELAKLGPVQITPRTHHMDGSLETAVLRAAPKLDAGQSVTYGFVPSDAEPDWKLKADVAQIPNRDLRVGIRLAGQENVEFFSLREMLAALWSQVSYWTQGPACQEFRLVDHLNRTFDVGPLRPQLDVQVWPTLGLVHVALKLMTKDVRQLEQASYSLQVEATSVTGNRASVIFQDDVVTPAGQEDTFEFWISEAAAYPVDYLSIPVLHDLQLPVDYLSGEGGLLLKMEDITADFSKWREGQSAASPKWALHGEGPLRPGGASAGGHPQLGLYPQWDLAALLRGNGETQLLSFDVMNRMGGYRLTPIETVPDESRVDDGASRPRLIAGKPVYRERIIGEFATSYGRPTTHSSPSYRYTQDRDRFFYQSDARPRFATDVAHLPRFGVIPYLLRGQRRDLDVLTDWACWVMHQGNGGGNSSFSHRGPTGKEGITLGEIRAQGYAMMTMAYAAKFAVNKKLRQQFMRTIHSQYAYHLGELSALTSSLPQYGRLFFGSEDALETFYWARAHGRSVNHQHVRNDSNPTLPFFADWESGGPAYVNPALALNPSKTVLATNTWQPSFCAAAAMLVDILHPGILQVEEVLGYIGQNPFIFDALLPESAYADVYVRPTRVVDAGGDVRPVHPNDLTDVSAEGPWITDANYDSIRGEIPPTRAVNKVGDVIIRNGRPVNSAYTVYYGLMVAAALWASRKSYISASRFKAPGFQMVANPSFSKLEAAWEERLAAVRSPEYAQWTLALDQTN